MLTFKLDSMYQSSIDIGEWLELIEPEHRQWIATNEFDRVKFRQEYVPKAIEERLLNIFLDDTFRHPEWTTLGQFDWVPLIDSDDWFDYLQSPNFPDDKWGFDGMTSEERDEYNKTKMWRVTNYSPVNDSLAHMALDYQINKDSLKFSCKNNKNFYNENTA